MKKRKFDDVLPLPGREDISLVRIKGDEYWQMMNSDGDLWGKFYAQYESDTVPFIYVTHRLGDGEFPVRINQGVGCKFIDPNTGYVSDYSYDDCSGYYRKDYGYTVIPIKYNARWYFRDLDGNCSQRLFDKKNEYHYSIDYFSRELVGGDSYYYERCFETNGKIKPLYALETLQASGEGVTLLKEDIERPIDKNVKYSLYVSVPLYFYKDRNGDLSESFYRAWPYNNGWSRVQKSFYDYGIQYRDTKGNLSRPFYSGTDYSNGFTVVCVEQLTDWYGNARNKKYCIRDIEGNLSTKWFESEYEALKEIELGNAKKYCKERILDTKVNDEQLKSYYFVDKEDKYGFKKVQKYVGGDFQFVDKYGNLSEPYYKSDGSIIKKYWNSGYQVRDCENGNLSQEVYYIVSSLGYDDNGCEIVQLKANGPYYLMDRDGNMSEPFGEINRECNGFYAVRKSFYHAYQIMDKNWHLSKKKYPDKESAEADIRSKGFIFVGEDTPTIKPRPKSDEIEADDKQTSKTDLER